MATIISGDTGIDKITDGSVVADDLASTLDLSGKTITLATDAAIVSKLSTASGSAPSYSARAWVNFNGSGTVAIRSSGNVSSITDHATGRYTVTFTTAMPDTNYSVAGSVIGTDDRGASNFGTNAPGCDATGTNTYTTTAVRFCIINNPDTAYVDCDRVSIQIFR